MVAVAQDFATRSLDITEETPGQIEDVAMETEEEEELEQFQLKRRWETRYTSVIAIMLVRHHYHILTVMAEILYRHLKLYIHVSTNKGPLSSCLNHYKSEYCLYISYPCNTQGQSIVINVEKIHCYLRLKTSHPNQSPHLSSQYT